MLTREVASEVAGTVWLINVKPGQSVAKDETLIILESMKMELPVSSPFAGVVTDILVEKSELVREGQAVVTVTPVTD